MSKVDVRLLSSAEQDLEALFLYIALEYKSPLAARRHYHAIVNAIKTLEIFPERCPLVPELADKGIDIRRLLVKNYSIFYRFCKCEVAVIKNKKPTAVVKMGSRGPRRAI